MLSTGAMLPCTTHVSTCVVDIRNTYDVDVHDGEGASKGATHEEQPLGGLVEHAVHQVVDRLALYCVTGMCISLQQSHHRSSHGIAHS